MKLSKEEHKQLRDLKKELDKHKNIPLSGHDVMELVKGQANVVLVRDLPKYNSIDELLEIGGMCYLLYEVEDDMGHWCCVLRTIDDHDNSIIEFFDTYGCPPDSQLDFIPTDYAESSGQNKKILTQLLLDEMDNNTPIHYNEFGFQKLDKNTKDCGRWCGLRGLLKNISLSDFSHLFMDMYADELATLATLNL